MKASAATLQSIADAAYIRARLATSDARAAARADGFARCAAELARHGAKPGDAAIAAFVPGRIEVLGKHTDYCGGRSLLCAVDRGFHFVATPRDDALVSFTSIDQAETVQAAFDPQLPLRPGHWSNYPLSSIRRLARNFEQGWTGCDIAFTSDLPPAAGLSSSSALIIGTFFLLAAINGLTEHPAHRRTLKTPEDLANYLGCVENGSSYGDLAGDCGVGTFGGSQDHTAILFAKAGSLVQYRFSPVVHEATIALPDEMRFVIASSGVQAEKTGAAREQYNAVSLRAWRLVSLWNEVERDHATNLRDVLTRPDAPARLRELIRSLPEADEARALHERLSQYQQESDVLIPQAARALACNEWNVLGRVVDESQTLAETHLHNQVPATIALQRLLRSNGAIAASAFGAGFGGSVWALAADLPAATRLVNAITAAGFAQPFVTRPAPPATLV